MFKPNEIVYRYTGLFKIYFYTFLMVNTVVLMKVVSPNVLAVILNTSLIIFVFNEL